MMNDKKLEGQEYSDFIKAWILNNSAYELEYNVRSLIEQFCESLEREEQNKSKIKDILLKLNPHPLDKMVYVGKNFTKKELTDVLQSILEG